MSKQLCMGVEHRGMLPCPIVWNVVAFLLLCQSTSMRKDATQLAYILLYALLPYCITITAYTESPKHSYSDTNTKLTTDLLPHFYCQMGCKDPVWHTQCCCCVESLQGPDIQTR